MSLKIDIKMYKICIKIQILLILHVQLTSSINYQFYPNISNKLTIQSLNQIKWNNILNNEETLNDLFNKLKEANINFTVPNLYDVTTTTKPNYKKYRKYRNQTLNSFLDILIYGSADDLRSASRKKVVHWIGTISLLPKISLQKKLILWEIFRNGISIEKLDRSDLEMIGNLILIIPENELFHINVMDLDILNYLGTMRDMTRQKAAILVYSLQNRYNQSILSNASLINNIKGLLCGYPEYALKKISDQIIDNINSTVFQNLWSCCEKQLEVLLYLFNKNTRVWNSNQIKHIGLLITVLQPDDIKELNPSSTSRINKEILLRMPINSINAFNKIQVDYFNNETRAVYNSRMFIAKSSCGCLTKTYYLLYLLLYITIKMY